MFPQKIYKVLRMGCFFGLPVKDGLLILLLGYTSDFIVL